MGLPYNTLGFIPFVHKNKGIVIYKEVPPKVEYTLIELGESFISVLHDMMKCRTAFMPAVLWSFCFKGRTFL